jgi:hypothetical protein
MHPIPLTPRMAGPYKRIIDMAAIDDPVIKTAAKPQVVDHCFFRAANGTWQAWVQIRDTTLGRVFTRWEQAGRFTDATWEYKGVCWTADKNAGESVGTPAAANVIQAPYVFAERDRYLLLYGGGPVDPQDTTRQICMAESRDGILFERRQDELGRSRITVGPRHCADAFLLKHGAEYYLYTCCAYYDVGGAQSALTVRRSSDLTRWSEPAVAHAGGTCGTHTHSSQSEYVIFRDGYFYLFVMGWSNEMKTAVYRSTDPTDFGKGDDNLATVLPASAAEVVQDGENGYISSLIVPGYDGVQVAPIEWREEAAEGSNRKKY